jgi:esterase/lipase
MERKNKAVLFLHGALGVAQDLAPLMNLCQERGFETHSFSFSGHGLNAPEPTEFRIDLFARDLESYLKKHNLKDITIFGYSMGGYVALYHKANFEDSPIKMIFTYGTKFNWSEKAVSKDLPMLNPEHLL